MTGKTSRRYPAKRQRLRRFSVLFSLLLFPIVLNYFSPYLIVEASSQGVVNGSAVVFFLMFLSALLFGRSWCSWACPGAGLQEIFFDVNNRPATINRLDWIKWVIWVPWIGLIAWFAVRSGGYRSIQMLYQTDNGFSVTAPFSYVIYYVVIGTFVILSLWLGRRGGCHAICWMAPFMILGRSLRNLSGWPSLRLEPKSEQCTGCQQCTSGCPMSLPVDRMVSQSAMEHHECILCGNCIDTCSSNAIRYSFSGGGHSFSEKAGTR